MKKSLILIGIVSPIFFTGCSPVDSVRPFNQQQAAVMFRENVNFSPARQMISLPLSMRNWQRIDMSYQTVGTPIMLIPKTEDRLHWTQSFRVEIRSYLRFPKINAEQFIANEINYQKEFCDKVEGNILASNQTFAIYHLSLSACQNKPDQEQYGKALNGKDAVYAVYYSWLPVVPQTEAMKAVIDRATLVNQS